MRYDTIRALNLFCLPQWHDALREPDSWYDQPRKRSTATDRREPRPHAIRHLLSHSTLHKETTMTRQRVNLTHSALLAMTLGLATSIANAATDHPFMGTWTGTWPNGLGIELTVTDVTDNEDVYGLYCNIREQSMTFIDLHPESGINANATDDTLEFKLGEISLAFTPEGGDPPSLKLTHKRKSKRHILRLEQTHDGECTARVTALPRPGR